MTQSNWAIPFLKAANWTAGIVLLVLCIFWLPSEASRASALFPEFSSLKYPVMIGLYITATMFFYAQKAFHALLHYVRTDQVFSMLGVNACKQIKNSGIVILLMYLVGSAFLFLQNALHPGIALISLLIMFTTLVIILFSSVLQGMFNKGMETKLS